MEKSYNREALLYLLSLIDVREGIDIVEVERIKKLVDDYGERFFQRLFAVNEKDRVLERFGKDDRLVEICAGYWAAKESVSKVLRTGIAKLGNPIGVPLRDVEIYHEESGAPHVRLYGKAKAVADRDGLVKLSVSISTEKNYVIASAVGIFVPYEV